ncbi:MrcB family domain-containing protein [Streptomyces sp. NPDC001935]
MHELLGEVLDLQKVWRAKNTKEMQRRGVIIRREITDWLRERQHAVAQAADLAPDNVGIEGRDATGLKAEVPWTRVYALDRSPSSTAGWYLVYLFSLPGDCAYLSLIQGTTVWDGGEFKPRRPAELRSRVDWARPLIARHAVEREDLVTSINLNARSSLGRGYETGNVVAIKYRRDALPNADVLTCDLLYMASLLGVLYRAESRAPYVPGDMAPEVVEATQSAARTAGRRPARPAGQRFDLTSSERRAVELHSVRTATEHFKAQGWSVKDVGATKSYDLHLRRGQEKLHVEVKGTISDGSQVILTRAEVERQREFAPNNALVVVHSIDLDRSLDPPLATGGTLHCTSPWHIEDDSLTVVSYIHQTGL